MKHILMGVLIMIKTGFNSFIAVVWANLAIILLAWVSLNILQNSNTNFTEIIPFLYYVFFPIIWIVSSSFELKEWLNLKQEDKK